MITTLYDITLVYAGTYLILSFINHLLIVFKQETVQPQTYTETIVKPTLEQKTEQPTYTIRQLKALASERHVKNYSNLNKQQLITLLGV